jgi:outer membrane protein
MRYFKFILFSLITLLPALAHSQVADTVLTLQQCIDIAIKNNLDVKKSELLLETGKLNYNQAKDGQIDHGINQGRNINPFTNTYVDQQLTYGNYSLNGDLTLFSGLQNLNRIKQASLAFEAGKMDFQQAKDLVTINVITSYLLVLDNTELLAQATKQLEVSKKQVERLEILEKEGANKSPSELYDIKGTYGDNQLGFVNATSTLETSKLNLIQILNIPYKKGIRLEPISAQDLAKQTPGSAEDVYAIALQQLAFVKAATLRRQSAEKAVKVAKGALWPTVSLFGGLYTNYSSAAQRSVFTDSTTVNTGQFINTPAGQQSVFARQANFDNRNIGYYDQFKNNYSTQFGISIRIPILNYFQNRNKVTQAKIDLKNYQYIEENTRIKLRQDVEQAYLNMESAYNRYNALQEQVKAYSESFRIAEIRFNAGVLNSVEYVLSKNYLDRANLNMINARYDCFIYNKILDYYQGRLKL